MEARGQGGGGEVRVEEVRGQGGGGERSGWRR